MPHPEPYHIFKANIFQLVHKDVPEITGEWLDTQESRLILFWNCGESSLTAYETIKAFALAAFSKTYTGNEKTPLQLAKSHRRI